MIMKWTKWLVTNALFAALFYAGMFWNENLLNIVQFWTWVIFILSLFLLDGDVARRVYNTEFAKNKLYGSVQVYYAMFMIGSFAYFGWFLYALLLTVVTILQMGARRNVIGGIE